MARRQLCVIYVEFASQKEAEERLGDLAWESGPDTVVQGADRDTNSQGELLNPKALKLTVATENSAHTPSRETVAALAKKIGALRITSEHRQIYP